MAALNVALAASLAILLGSAPPAAEWLAGVVEPIPIYDGAWIDSYVTDQRIVLIGEEVHGVAEHLELKGELARRLVEKHGFTHIAIEDDVFKVASLDRGLRAAAAPSARTLLGDLFWCWNVQEMAALIDSLAAEPHHPVFIGMDVQTAHYAIESLDAKAKTPEQVAALKAVKSIFAADGAAYAALSDEQHALDRTAIQNLNAVFADADANREAQHLLRVQRMREVTGQYGPSMNARDQGMAESIQDILNENPNNRIVILAHNAHAGYTTYYDSFTGGVIPLGKRLRDSTGGKTLSIGAVYTIGSVLLDPRQRTEQTGLFKRVDQPTANTQAEYWSAFKADRWLLDPKKVSAAKPPPFVGGFLAHPPAGYFDNYGPARSLDSTYDLIVGYRTVHPATPITE